MGNSKKYESFWARITLVVGLILTVFLVSNLALADARYSCADAFQTNFIDTKFDEKKWKQEVEDTANRFWNQHDRRNVFRTGWSRVKEASRKAMLYFLQRNPVPAKYAKDNETLSVAVSLIHSGASPAKGKEIDETLAAIAELEAQVAILSKQLSELKSDQEDEIRRIIRERGEAEEALRGKLSALESLKSDLAAINADIEKGVSIVEGDMSRMHDYEKQLALKIMEATNVLIRLEYLYIARKQFQGVRLTKAENAFFRKMNIKTVKLNRGREEKIIIQIPQLEADGTFGVEIITVFSRLGINEHIRAAQNRRKEMFGGLLKRNIGSGFGEEVRQLEYDYGDSYNRVRLWYRTILKNSANKEITGDLETLVNKLQEAMRSDHRRPSLRARSVIAYFMVIEEFKTRVTEANDQFGAVISPATQTALGDKALATLKKKNGITDFTPLGILRWVKTSVQTAIGLAVATSLIGVIYAFNDKLIAGFWNTLDYVSENGRNAYYWALPSGHLERVEDIAAGFYQEEGADPRVTFNAYLAEHYPHVLMYRLKDIDYRKALAAGDQSAKAPEKPPQEDLNAVWAMEVHFSMLMTVKERQLSLETKSAAEQEEIRKQIELTQNALRTEILKVEGTLQSIGAIELSIDRLSEYYLFFKNQRGLDDATIGPMLARLVGSAGGGLTPEPLDDADDLEKKIFKFLEDHSAFEMEMTNLPHEVQVDMASILAYEVAIKKYKDSLVSEDGSSNRNYYVERGRKVLADVAGQRVAFRYAEDAIIASVIAKMEELKAAETEAAAN